MPITVANVRAIAPDLSSSSDEEIQIWIDLADDFLRFSVFGPRADTARRLFVAHQTLALRGGSGTAGGALTSKAVGEASASFAAAGGRSAAAGEYASTRFGVALYGMIRAATSRGAAF
jgi:hypothetical protein